MSLCTQIAHQARDECMQTAVCNARVKQPAVVIACAEWLCGPQAATALSMLSLSSMASSSTRAGRNVDGMVSAQEDTLRGLKCSQAMTSVQAYEGSCSIITQVTEEL